MFDLQLHEPLAFIKRKEGIACLASQRMAREAPHQQGRVAQTTGKPSLPYEFTWAFHDGDEMGPKMLARIAKQTGLKPEDI